MCGILGAYGEHKLNSDCFSNALKLQSSRGPDNLTVDVHNGNFIGHARLSIHDLSAKANQPMYSSCKRFSIIFNGEVYNFKELKEKHFPGVDFSTDSDTEVLLRLIIKYDVEETLKMIKGMFSFVFFDSKLDVVKAVRDPYGEKPFYYTLTDKSLIVSSSLYSIVQLKKETEIDKFALSTYLHYGYVKGAQTLLSSIKKLEPGHIIKYDLNEFEHTITKYEPEIDSSNNKPVLEDLIRNSVISMLDADVPVGCFLSGGVDSSLISSYVADFNPNVTAYSLGFQDECYDESSIAVEVAKHLGIPIKVLKLSNVDLYKLIDDTEHVFDEPFADASYLAMYALSRFARNDVSVCLSGDAGDELFSGYNRHLLVPHIYNRFKCVPVFIRRAICKFIEPGSAVRTIALRLTKMLYYKSQKATAIEERFDKLYKILPFKDLDDLFFRVLAGNDYSEALLLPPPYKETSLVASYRDLAHVDFKSYLHEDVLTKVDRATMATSLEARVPFLDPEIVNYARLATDNEHIEGGVQKFALKKLLSKKVPNAIIDRPKSGFSVPYKDILDNHLQLKFKLILSDIELMEPDFCINNASIIQFVEDYYSGVFFDYKLIWNVFFYLRWYKNILSICRGSSEFTVRETA